MVRKQKLPPPDSTLYENTTEFRILERTIKRKGPVDHAIFTDIDSLSKQSIQLFGIDSVCYNFKEYPGLYLVKGAIPANLQKQLIKEILEEWTRPPNVSNLDSHFHIPPNGIWNEYISSKSKAESILIKKRMFTQENEMYIENENSNIPAQIPINSKCTTSSSNFCAMKMPSCTSTSTCGDPNEKVISVIDPESNLIIDKPTDSMAKQDDVMIEKVLPRLRWLTLGHQYNWTKKEYHFDRVPEVPESIKSLSYEIVKSFEHIIHYDPKLWRPEAGIVNFYQPGDSLMAHQDKSEINTTAPLLSISLGLECVFLIGTDDRKDKPMALKLQSGDLIIMSGNSRRAFHGVPRLLENTCPEFLLSDNPEWINFKDYLSHTRLNVNLRQVF